MAIASILKNPGPFAGRYIDISSFRTTQNEILKIFEDETNTKWTIEKKNTEDSLKTANDKLSQGDYSAFSDYLKHHLWKDGGGRSATDEQLANEELGLPKEDLRATVKVALAG